MADKNEKGASNKPTVTRRQVKTIASPRDVQANDQVPKTDEATLEGKPPPSSPKPKKTKKPED